MPPKMLVLVQPAIRTLLPITNPADWVGVGCAVCERVMDQDPAAFVVDDEVRCIRCVTAPTRGNTCIWCGRPDSRVQDTGYAMCQPHWALYVAYVADEVEPPDSAFNQLRRETREALDAAATREDHPTGERPA